MYNTIYFTSKELLSCSGVSLPVQPAETDLVSPLRPSTKHTQRYNGHQRTPILNHDVHGQSVHRLLNTIFIVEILVESSPISSSTNSNLKEDSYQDTCAGSVPASPEASHHRNRTIPEYTVHQSKQSTNPPTEWQCTMDTCTTLAAATHRQQRLKVREPGPGLLRLGELFTVVPRYSVMARVTPWVD